MSKYNDLKEVPINDLNESELQQAFKEWSEGDKYLEELLESCHNNGVETVGCHTEWHLGAANPSYFSVRVNESHDKIKKMLEVIKDTKELAIRIEPDGGSPNSGDNWYKPILSVDRLEMNKKLDCTESGDIVFKQIKEKLTEEREDEHEDDSISALLDLYDFFTGKDSNLTFSMNHKNENEYEFNITTLGNERDWDYYNDLCEHAGLTRIEQEDESPIAEWSTSAESYELLSDKIKKCRDVLLSEYSLEIPNEIREDMTFINAQARVKRREFGDTPEGRQKLKEWVDEKLAPLHKRIKASEIEEVTRGVSLDDFNKATKTIKESSKDNKKSQKDMGEKQ